MSRSVVANAPKKAVNLLLDEGGEVQHHEAHEIHEMAALTFPTVMMTKRGGLMRLQRGILLGEKFRQVGKKTVLKVALAFLSLLLVAGFGEQIVHLTHHNKCGHPRLQMMVENI